MEQTFSACEHKSYLQMIQESWRHASIFLGGFPKCKNEPQSIPIMREAYEMSQGSSSPPSCREQQALSKGFLTTDTLPETNITPEHSPRPQKEIHLNKPSVVRGKLAVGFREGNRLILLGSLEAMPPVTSISAWKHPSQWEKCHFLTLWCAGNILWKSGRETKIG